MNVITVTLHWASLASQTEECDDKLEHTGVTFREGSFLPSKQALAFGGKSPADEARATSPDSVGDGP